MSNSNGTSTPWAVYPLTRFDSMHGKVDIVAGWLIEGLLDVQKLRAALDRLVSKWPMLAGRLESDDPVYMYDMQLRIPLGPLPAGYEPYILTSNGYPSLPNLVNITGRLADGSALLDVVLNRERMRVISEEIQRILKEVERSDL